MAPMGNEKAGTAHAERHRAGQSLKLCRNGAPPCSGGLPILLIEPASGMNSWPTSATAAKHLTALRAGTGRGHCP